jgi:hypothetical protein
MPQYTITDDMSSLPQISTELSFAFLLGFIVSTSTAIIQYVNSRNSARQVSQTSILKAIELMEASRESRHILYALKRSQKPFSQWSDPEKKAADTVVRAFDILGVLDNCKNIDRRFVDRFYSIPALELWETCKPFIDYERRERPTKYWEYEYFVSRIGNVKANHPTTCHRKNWPRFPRRKYMRLLNQ